MGTRRSFHVELYNNEKGEIFYELENQKPRGPFRLFSALVHDLKKSIGREQISRRIEQRRMQ